MPYPPFRLARRRVSATIWDIVFHFPSLLTATACQNCHYFRDGLKAAHWRKACTILPLKILSNLMVLDLYFPIFKSRWILQGCEDSERWSAHQTYIGQEIPCAFLHLEMQPTLAQLTLLSAKPPQCDQNCQVFTWHSIWNPNLIEHLPHCTNAGSQNLDGNNQTQSIASSQKKRFGHKYLTTNDSDGWKWKKPWSNPSPGHSWRSCTQQHQCGCHHQLQACNLFSQYQDLQTNIWESSPSVKISS